jgi:hypothetical protein
LELLFTLVSSPRFFLTVFRSSPQKELRREPACYRILRA